MVRGLSTNSCAIISRDSDSIVMAAVTGALAEATPATRDRRESVATFSAGG